MKKIIKFTSIFALTVASVGGVLTSCVADEPFGMGGEADVRMRFVINSDVTRAEVDDDDLRANCVVYISSEKGLIHKYKGLENVPEVIQMKCGNYVAEAWTGDSVPASFDKKFYRGYMPFTVEKGVNSPVLKCGIANVVASVNASTIDSSLLPEYTITIGHSRGSLDFTAENVNDAKGYFMMPDGETELTYKVKGRNSNGQEFTKEGKINGKGLNGAVERAHEYVLNVAYNPEYEAVGGAFITISIDDREILIEDQIEIYGRPNIAGVGFDVEKQLVGNAGAFKDELLKITAFGDLKQLVLTDEESRWGLPTSEIDLMNLTQSAAADVEACGITLDKRINTERNLAVAYLTFDSSFLNKLAEASEEYRLKIHAEDAYGKSYDAVLRIAVGEGAIVIDDPVVVEAVDQNSDFMAIGAKSATLYLNVVNMEATNKGLEYKLADAGDDAWKFVSIENAVQQSRKRAPRRAAAQRYKVSLDGLQPGQLYVYRAVSDEFKGNNFYFTTEKIFEIPNASMEDWSTLSSNSKVVLPGAGGVVSFWDSGNHGSATMSKSILQSSTAMVHSGQYSAELKSQFVGLGSIGKFAAGNLFVGKYEKTDGTDGELTFGREYNGSHPKKLVLYCNYRPGVGVSNKGGNSNYIPVGSKDIGHIFVALSTESFYIKTKNQSQLFDKNSTNIVAYGEVLLNDNYGPDGSLAKLEIPLEYRQNASTKRPLYLVLVCTASRYGDYFSGGEGSLMYVDDFEFEY